MLNGFSILLVTHNNIYNIYCLVNYLVDFNFFIVAYKGDQSTIIEFIVEPIYFIFIVVTHVS